MKPTVITNNSNGGSNGNTPTATTTATTTNSPPGGQTPYHHHTTSSTMDPNNNPNIRNQFQNFEGFGFDPDMDDVFSDAGIRSRLNRIPFGFGSRKRVNDPNRYFNTDDDDFFSRFGSLGRRRQPQADRSGIFEHIPAEFRQYMPDGFEFPSTMRNTPQSPRYSGSQPTQNPAQYYETYTQPGPGSPPTNQPQAQPKPQKPNLCDAAIQTDNTLDETSQQPNKTHKTQPLKQHGLRNTVDLGQISPPENESSPRAQSAPPTDPSKQNFTNSSVASGSDPNQPHVSSTAYAYIPPSQQTRWQPQSPPPSAQHRPQIPHPPPRSMPQQQYYQSTAQSPQPQSSSQPDSATIRTVPIFVEGRSEPVINEHKYPTFESHPSTQQETPPHAQKQFYPQQPQPSQYQPSQQYQQQSHPQQPHSQQQAPRPTPINTQQANAASEQQSPVPSTPQTTATIEKIQSIQRDVLDLMSKVEKFKGMKADKEYMYLDEMLTRNLLKLDTIDTQGKERIRLARKEAIKCIQASINVLEAKAEENAKTAQKSVMNAQDEINTSTVPQIEETENINDNDIINIQTPTTTTILDEASTTKLPDVVPLPPPPQLQPQSSSTNQLVSENQQIIENEEKSNLDQNVVELQIEEQQEQQLKSEHPEINKTETEIVNTEQRQLNNNESTAVVQSNDDTINNNNVPNSVAVDQQQENKDTSKESPKKKIIKKIIKKSEKKDKKESTAAATPPSETQDITTLSPSSQPPSEISKD